MSDETADELEAILGKCVSVDEIRQQIAKYALIVQCLVCLMAKDVDQSTDGIRALYGRWADMAVDQFTKYGVFGPKRRH
jgi:hypothetical protein